MAQLLAGLSAFGLQIVEGRVLLENADVRFRFLAGLGINRGMDVLQIAGFAVPPLEGFIVMRFVHHHVQHLHTHHHVITVR